MSTATSYYAHVREEVSQWPANLRRSLVDDIVKSLEEDLPAMAGEWSQSLNTRRCELIEKELDGALTDAETGELERLQTQAIAHRDRVAPLPLAAAERLQQQLLAKKRQGSE